MHVFTYGTLMFAEVWRSVVGREFRTVGGVAGGFAIYRVRDAVFPGIVAASQSESVRGVVHLDVDAESLARLDLFEDDFYRRHAITVACEDGELREAEAYIVPPENRAVLTSEPWHGEEFIARGDLERFLRNFPGFGHLGDND